MEVAVVVKLPAWVVVVVLTAEEKEDPALLLLLLLLADWFGATCPPKTPVAGTEALPALRASAE